MKTNYDEIVFKTTEEIVFEERLNQIAREHKSIGAILDQRQLFPLDEIKPIRTKKSVQKEIDKRIKGRRGGLGEDDIKNSADLVLESFKERGVDVGSLTSNYDFELNLWKEKSSKPNYSETRRYKYPELQEFLRNLTPEQRTTYKEKVSGNLIRLIETLRNQCRKLKNEMDSNGIFHNEANAQRAHCIYLMKLEKKICAENVEDPILRQMYQEVKERERREAELAEKKDKLLRSLVAKDNATNHGKKNRWSQKDNNNETSNYLNNILLQDNLNSLQNSDAANNPLDDFLKKSNKVRPSLHAPKHPPLEENLRKREQVLRAERAQLTAKQARSPSPPTTADRKLRKNLTGSSKNGMLLSSNANIISNINLNGTAGNGVITGVSNNNGENNSLESSSLSPESKRQQLQQQQQMSQTASKFFAKVNKLERLGFLESQSVLKEEAARLQSQDGAAFRKQRDKNNLLEEVTSQWMVQGIQKNQINKTVSGSVNSNNHNMQNIYTHLQTPSTTVNNTAVSSPAGPVGNTQQSAPHLAGNMWNAAAMKINAEVENASSFSPTKFMPFHEYYDLLKQYGDDTQPPQQQHVAIDNVSITSSQQSLNNQPFTKNKKQQQLTDDSHLHNNHHNNTGHLEALLQSASQQNLRQLPPLQHHPINTSASAPVLPQPTNLFKQINEIDPRFESYMKLQHQAQKRSKTQTASYLGSKLNEMITAAQLGNIVNNQEHQVSQESSAHTHSQITPTNTQSGSGTHVHYTGFDPAHSQDNMNHSYSGHNIFARREHMINKARPIVLKKPHPVGKDAIYLIDIWGRPSKHSNKGFVNVFKSHHHHHHKHHHGHHHHHHHHGHHDHNSVSSGKNSHHHQQDPNKQEGAESDSDSDSGSTSSGTGSTSGSSASRSSLGSASNLSASNQHHPHHHHHHHEGDGHTKRKAANGRSSSSPSKSPTKHHPTTKGTGGNGGRISRSQTPQKNTHDHNHGASHSHEQRTGSRGRSRTVMRTSSSDDEDHQIHDSNEHHDDLDKHHDKDPHSNDGSIVSQGKQATTTAPGTPNTTTNNTHNNRNTIRRARQQQQLEQMINSANTGGNLLLKRRHHGSASGHAGHYDDDYDDEAIEELIESCLHGANNIQQQLLQQQQHPHGRDGRSGNSPSGKSSTSKHGKSSSPHRSKRNAVEGSSLLSGGNNNNTGTAGLHAGSTLSSGHGGSVISMGDLQEKLQVIWETLEFTAVEKFSFMSKYSTEAYASEMSKAIDLWGEAALCVILLQQVHYLFKKAMKGLMTFPVKYRDIVITLYKYIPPLLSSTSPLLVPQTNVYDKFSGNNSVASFNSNNSNNSNNNNGTPSSPQPQRSNYLYSPGKSAATGSYTMLPLSAATLNDIRHWAKAIFAKSIDKMRAANDVIAVSNYLSTKKASITPTSNSNKSDATENNTSESVEQTNNAQPMLVAELTEEERRMQHEFMVKLRDFGGRIGRRFLDSLKQIEKLLNDNVIVHSKPAREWLFAIDHQMIIPGDSNTSSFIPRDKY